jgi:hypothetical protein
MKIKLSFTLIIFIFAISLTQAQEDEKNKRQEVTFLMSSFDDIGIGYRFGTSKALWRVSLTGDAKSTEHIINDSIGRSTNTQSSLSIELGREYRFKVADNLFLRLGGDIFYGQNLLKNESGEDERFQHVNKRVNTEYGMKIVSGLMYQPTERIHLGFELLPSFSRIESERSSGSAIDQAPTIFNTISEESFAFSLNNSSLRFNVGFNF